MPCSNRTHTTDQQAASSDESARNAAASLTITMWVTFDHESTGITWVTSRRTTTRGGSTAGAPSPFDKSASLQTSASAAGSSWSSSCGTFAWARFAAATLESRRSNSAPSRPPPMSTMRCHWSNWWRSASTSLVFAVSSWHKFARDRYSCSRRRRAMSLSIVGERRSFSASKSFMAADVSVTITCSSAFIRERHALRSNCKSHCRRSLASASRREPRACSSVAITI